MSDLYDKLAEAYARPSRAYRTFEEAADIPQKALTGYLGGTQIADQLRKRKNEQMTLSDALGGQLPAGLAGFGGTTVERAGELAKPIEAIAALNKANQERSQKGLQFVGTKDGKAVLFNPNTAEITTGDLPAGDGPITPKAVSPTVSPYVDPGTGQPLIFTPGAGLSPAKSTGASSGTPTLKAGNEQAIGDVALMQTQAPNIDKLFNAYAAKGPMAARAQATPIGRVLDPETKQLENSLKLAAFTFGGKNLTGQEKSVVFGAFFPSATDNAASLEQKRNLLKDYFSGKVDLLQAANLLGPTGNSVKAMLQNKVANQPQPNVTSVSALDPEAEAAISRVNSAAIPDAEKKARITAIRARASRPQ